MAQDSLQIELATPASKRSIGEAQSCSAPGVEGKFQILPHHTAFVSELATGEVKVDLLERTQYFAITGGYLEVVDNKVLLLLEAAEAAEDIDVARAEQAKQRAEHRLQSKDSDVDITRAHAALSRALNRLATARKASR